MTNRNILSESVEYWKHNLSSLVNWITEMYVPGCSFKLKKPKFEKEESELIEDLLVREVVENLNQEVSIEVIMNEDMNIDLGIQSQMDEKYVF